MNYLTSQLPHYLVPFFSLSSPTDAPENPDSFHDSIFYKTDPKDLCLVITFIAVMAILRDALRLGVFEPFVKWKLSRDLKSKRKQQAVKTNGSAGVASNGNGHSTAFTKAEHRKMKHSVFRFAEQGWPFVYYPLQWSLGLYIHSKLPTKVLNPVDAWTDYPHIPLAAPVKIYYLTQLAFYVHQVLILNAEARRKDHVQMMAHHVITIFLVWTSYYYNLTRIGCLIMMLMDFCDILLCLAKMLRYLELPQILPDMTFGVFLVSWLITRHILFYFAIKSTILDMPRVAHFGQWDPARGYYLTKGSHYMFSISLIALEIIQIIWFGMICRVAWRVITAGKNASDVRSDEEGENDETDDKEE